MFDIIIIIITTTTIIIIIIIIITADLQPQRAVKGVRATAISGLWFASRKALGFFLQHHLINSSRVFLDQKGNGC